MSRSFKVHKFTFEKVPDHVKHYKCRCSRCTHGKLKYQRIGEDLLEEGLQEADRDYAYLFHDSDYHRDLSTPRRCYSNEMNSAQYYSTVTVRPMSFYGLRALKKLRGIGGIGSTHRC